MHNLVKISQQTLWQILGKVVTSLSTFIILGLVTRNYGEEGTGIYTLAITYLAIFNLLSDFGFNAHALKKFQIEEFRKLLGTRILWSVFLVVLAIGLLPFWPFTNLEFAKSVVLGSLVIFGYAIFTTCNLVFQSKLRYDLSVVASSIGTLAWVVIIFWFIQLQLKIPFLVLSHFLAWVIIALASLLLVRKLIKKMAIEFDLGYTKKLFRQSWPIAATLTLNVVYFRADSFMIAYFKGVQDTGIYNVAYSLFQTALVLPTFIMNSYYPLMLKSLKGIKLVALGLLGMAILGAFLTYILAPIIMKVLTGSGFLGSAQSLRILALGFPAYFVSSLMMWMMVVKNKYKTMLLVYGLGLIVNFILNLIYIPKYSFLAAAWITVISEYLILAMQLMVLWYGHGRDPSSLRSSG